MNNLVNAIFGVLNAVAVKNNNAQDWLNDKIKFLAELADVLNYGVQSTNFAWFWVTGTVLADEEILGLDEFNDIINNYNYRLNFALYLGTNDFISYLDDRNYDDFVKFHNYFWEAVAYETVGQGV